MKNTWNDFVKPIVVLGVICLVTSLLLAVTNNVTAPIIAENAVKTANATRQALLPSADTFTEVAPETPTEGVTAIYKADNDSGYVITAQAKGYGGEVPVMVAFNAEGTIEAVQFLDNDETPGLGQKVKSEAFQSQFSGMPAEEFGLSDIDAITGATISSGAAASAINAAIAAYNQEAGVAGEDLSTLSPEELRAALDEMFRHSSVLLAQEFIPTEFDWRIGLLDGEPLFACKYYMAKGHWQIYNHAHDDTGRNLCGAWETVPIYKATQKVLDTAVKAAALIGKGLYGVDLKLINGRAVVIEINDNPSIDHEVEDAVLGDELYYRILNHFVHCLNRLHAQ